MEVVNSLAEFSRNPNIADKWVAARQLMSDKMIVSVADTDEFLTGLRVTGDIAANGDGLDRLLAVDLIERMSSFVKKIRPQSEEILANALLRELPPPSLVSDTKQLPADAKPAEIRENIASSLAFASDGWVVSYVISAIAKEDRSQKCRLELAEQLSRREKSVDFWLTSLMAALISQEPDRTGSQENLVSRLRDILASLRDIVNRKRLQIETSEDTGSNLARLCERIIIIRPKDPLPNNLETLATEIAMFTDELVTTNLTLIVDPDAYAPLQTIERWWRPLPYTKPLRESLSPLIEKILTAITLSARMERRSENLVARLRQAFNDNESAKKALVKIADQENGLSREIDDWLRGRSRSTAKSSSILARALRDVSDENISEQLATLVLDLSDTPAAPEQLSREQLLELVSRLELGIRSIANKRNLLIFGKRGELVEFSSKAHEFVGGGLPSDVKVRIVRPMVVRKRTDGSNDIIVKALVDEVV